MPALKPAAGKNRAFMPDLLKAIAIFGVVFIHGDFLTGDGPLAKSLGDVFRFCVPIFITVWAFYMEKAYLKGRPWYAVVPAKFMVLLIPFCFWSLIYFLISPGWQNLSLPVVITRYWLGYGWSGQYFFIILFQLVLLFPVLRLLPASPRAVLIVFAGFTLAFAALDMITCPDLVQRLSYRPFVYWLPNVLLGIFLARNPTLFAPFTWALCGLALIIIETLVSHWPMIPWNTAYEWDYIKPGVLIGSALIASAFLNKSSQREIRPRTGQTILSIMGQNTMGIFVINRLVWEGLRSLFERAGWHPPAVPAEAIGLTFPAVLAVVAFCIIITLALKCIGLSKLVN